MSDPNEIYNFSQLIANHEDGLLNTDLSHQVRDIIAALNQHVIDHGGKPSATLSIKLNFKLDSNSIEVTASTGSNLPKEVRGKTIYWSTSGNVLTRQNPRQHSLPFRDVNTKQDVI